MKFATCLNCIDGRTQLPIIQWIKDNYNVDYVDMITEPGMDGVLNDKNYHNMDGLLKKIEISLTKHNSKIIFIAGHYDCAGNPVDEETHKEQISRAVEKLKRLYGFVLVVGLWISKEWRAEEVIKK